MWHVFNLLFHSRSDILSPHLIQNNVPFGICQGGARSLTPCASYSDWHDQCHQTSLMVSFQPKQGVWFRKLGLWLSQLMWVKVNQSVNAFFLKHCRQNWGWSLSQSSWCTKGRMSFDLMTSQSPPSCRNIYCHTVQNEKTYMKSCISWSVASVLCSHTFLPVNTRL